RQVALGAELDPMPARADLGDERRAPDRLAVDEHLGLRRRHRRELDLAGQLRQLELEALILRQTDVDLGIERIVAGKLRDDAMLARTEHEAVGEAKLEQRARQLDDVGLGLELERYRPRGEREPREEREHGEDGARRDGREARASS